MGGVGEVGARGREGGWSGESAEEIAWIPVEIVLIRCWILRGSRGDLEEISVKA